MTDAAIEDHALLSDRHSAALVSSDGTIDWLCFPRFDSPSVFGALLDNQAGSWSIRPLEPAKIKREYVHRSMAVLTTFHTATGTMELVDAMVLGPSGDPHRLGEYAPHALVRRVSCTQGRVTVDMRFRPRPEYGLITPRLTCVEGGIEVWGGPDRLVLSVPGPATVSLGEVCTRMTLSAEEVRYFGIRYSPLGTAMPAPYSQEEMAAGLDATITGWRAWSAAHQQYEGPWQDLVHHSGRVLHALSYQPTGAIVAAATTSLPEAVGEERNWDYRYSWLRDASLTMEALWVAACPDEAHEFFDFVTAAAADSRVAGSLQIVFGVGGERDLSERVLPHLSGWRASRPVRVGNGAWTQTQLDVHGELLQAAHRFRDQLGNSSLATRDFLADVADAAADNWEQPDCGIWEIRGRPRHFLHSKLMCWVALDRAVAMAGQLDARDRADRWATTAALIREAILTQGWHPEAKAFTQAFGAPELDASALMMPMVGFLPPDDPRVVSTIDAVAEQLVDARGLVYRYHTDSQVDGLSGGEGTFLLCTFWLAHALALAGRAGEARLVFERAIAQVNDVGLLAEEIDPIDGAHLGNFPQALSHIGLVNAAWAIHQAETSRGTAEARP
ncbi:glycoside hydrolase family 15 protein [Streptomyces sp. 049-1]|uniref:glycoside hydrolase family 15 protein n=1 Tax=Streptomyces sp. 049-1 TaxID=2789264 RepID=UPI0039812A3B